MFRGGKGRYICVAGSDMMVQLIEDYGQKVVGCSIFLCLR